MGGLPKSTLKVLLGGQQQDIVPRLVPIGSALVIENMVFDHQGNLVKRAGSTALADTSIPAGVTAPRAWALGRHRGALLRLGRQGQQPIEVRSTVNGPWLAPIAGSATSSRGPMIATVQKIGPVATAGNSYDHHDIALGNGYQCVTYQEQGQASPGKVHQLLIDLATGNVLMDRLAGPSGHQQYPHVAVVAGRYACFSYNANATLTVDVFDLQAADPTLVTQWTQPGDIVADTPLEIVPHQNGADLLIAYMGQSGQFRAAIMHPSTATAGAIVNLKTQSAGAILASNAFAWVQNFHGVTWSNGYPGLVIRDASTGLTQHMGWVQIDASNYSAGRTTVIDGSDHSIVNIATATAGTGTGSNIAVDIIWDTTGGTVRTVKHAGVTAGGSFSTSPDTMNVSLASKLFTDAGGRPCYLVVTPWTDQATLYVMPIRTAADNFPAPQCRTEVQTAAPLTSASHLPSVAVANANTVYVTAGVQVPMGIAASGPPLPVSGKNVDVVKLQFRNGVEPMLPAPVLGNPVEAIESTFVPGGQLMQWDGKNYVAAGFAYAPQAPTVSTSLTAGSLTTNFDYQYVAVYARTDAQGRRWRSAPSAVATQNTGTATSTSLQVNYLQLVDAPNVEVELYRTNALQPSLFKKLPGIYPNVAGDPANPFLSITDTYADTTLAAGEFLYAQGNILPNEITPGFTCLVVFDGRLWGVSADDPQALWFTDALTPPGVPAFDTGAGLFFSSSLIVDVRDDRGPITGLGVCDGRMVVFKHDAVYTIEGNGPDATGVGSTYIAQRVAGSAGSDNPRSIVDAFDGVWFQSSSDRAGLWRLDRGTSLAYMGQGVRDLVALPVVGGVSLPEQSQIRWYTYDPGGGHVLVYDVITQAWTTFTNPFIATSAACATGWNGVAAWSSEGPSTLGQVLVETAGLYADAGFVFGQRAVFPWLQLADLLGFQRVYSYQGIGQTIDDHQIRAILYRNLNDADNAFASQDFTMLPSSNPTWEWEVRFPMKLSAVKLELLGEPAKVDGVTPTAGFALSGIAIEYGIKVGLKPTVYTHRLTHA